VIFHCLRISGLRLGAADIVLESFEQNLDFSAGTVVFNDLPDRKARLGRKQSDPLALTIDPDHLNLTP
jgi:hypothetical protein